MPQMSPLPWLPLMITSALVFIMFWALTFWAPLTVSTPSLSQHLLSKAPWKW